MLSVLDELTRPLHPVASQGYHWFELNDGQLHASLPFWNDHDIQRISQSMRAKGILLLKSAPFSQCQQLIFAFNEPASEAEPVIVSGVRRPTAPPATTPVTAPTALNAIGATPIAPNWQPSQETLARIAQHNIPEQYMREQVPEFVTFWRESGEAQRSWGSKFHKHVVNQWRKRETFTTQKDQEISMHNQWRPSGDALDVLCRHAGINAQFVEDAIPEFVLYWTERGERSRTWNSKFIQHVRRQWARYTAALEHDSEPRRIPDNWQPGDDVYDILRMANIDLKFARQLLPEFVIFWRDSNQVYASWNTKFLQHVKYHWAKRHALTPVGTTQGKGNEGQQPAAATGHSTGRTRDRSLAEDLNDRSWAF